MRIAIVGSRKFKALHLVVEFVNGLPEDTVIVSGGAPGVDRTAAEAAEARGLKTLIFKPEWEKHGKVAGFIRNADIIANADEVVAFWDGKSHGTAHSMSLAKNAQKKLVVVADDPTLPDPPPPTPCKGI